MDLGLAFQAIHDHRHQSRLLLEIETRKAESDVNYSEVDEEGVRRVLIVLENRNQVQLHLRPALEAFVDVSEDLHDFFADFLRWTHYLQQHRPQKLV